MQFAPELRAASRSNSSTFGSLPMWYAARLARKTTERADVRVQPLHVDKRRKPCAGPYRRRFGVGVALSDARSLTVSIGGTALVSCCRLPSNRRGPSRNRCGKIPSAKPGTNNTAKHRSRTALEYLRTLDRSDCGVARHSDQGAERKAPLVLRSVLPDRQRQWAAAPIKPPGRVLDGEATSGPSSPVRPATRPGSMSREI